MKCQTLTPTPGLTLRALPAPHKPAQQPTQRLQPPGATSQAALERTDPRRFTELAVSIAHAPDDHVVGMDPLRPRTLHTQPRAALRAPHDRFHPPPRALVHRTVAHERLLNLVGHWSERIEVLRHPQAREAMALLMRLLIPAPARGIPVQALRKALNTLSVALDPDSVLPTLAQPVPANAVPDLSGLVSAFLGSGDEALRPNLRAVAGLLQDALTQPQGELDLSWIDAEDIDDFAEAGGMSAFLAARLAVMPPLEHLTLSSELEAVSPFVWHIPTLQELVLPNFEGDCIDLRGLHALHTVCFSGDVPDQVAVRMPDDRTVRLENGDGEELVLAPLD